VHARFLFWFAALVVAIASLLPVGRVAPAPRFDEPDAAAWYDHHRRAPSRALDTVALYDLASARVERMTRFSSRIARTLPSTVSKASVLDAWTSLGPGNIGGRTRVVRFHPTNDSTLFAAGVSGGIWRSDDAGGTWRSLPSGLVNIAVNSLVIDPSRPETMYAGTGEGYFREDIRGTGLPLRGGGVFVTSDGGESWTGLSSTTGPDFHWVNDLELSPGDSRVLYAATRSGVWRSQNTGETWERLFDTQVRGGCLDLVLRRDESTDTLFASCGSYDQASVYRFRRAATDTDVDVVLREPGMGRTSLALAPSNPQVIYALAASNEPGPDGLYRQGLLAVYRSDTGGEPSSWTPRVTNQDPLKIHRLLLTNAPAAMVEECGSTTGRNTFINMGWYVNVIAVDPRDADRVWVGGVDWFRSDDGGRSWGFANAGSGRAGMHVDQHGIVFHPRYDGVTNQTVIVGNDGGIYRTRSARGRVATGASAPCIRNTIEVEWESLNRGYTVTQFYHGTPFPDGRRYLGGAQDNGSILGTDDAGNNGWRLIFGGDGGHVAVDPTNPQTVYVETQWANIVKSTDGGARFSSATRGLDPVRSDVLGPDANYLFITPFVLDPSNAQRLWTGGEFLYRSSNGAAQWTKASTALPEGGLMSAIAVAATDSNRVVAGTHRGDIVTSRTALATSAQSQWSATRPRDGWVTSVAFDPRNADVLYATYGNFGGAHVFRSSDGGATWQAIDGGGDNSLPDIPVHSIVIDPDDPTRLYLGTDAGVFVSIDGGQRWLVEETGFGPAVTEWLSLLRDASGRKQLFAFTHGRGAWRVDMR
jgi:photosystem II stability/assembly factor-like uncharacterized protein